MNAYRHNKGRGNPPLWFRGLLLALLLILFAGLWLKLFPAPPPGGFALNRHPDRITSDPAPLFQTQFASHGKTRFVHSPAVVEISGGRFRAFWYGGTDEGAGDIAIYTSVFDPEKGRWALEEPLITKEITGEGVGRFVKTLGNCVVLGDEGTRLWLFYVSVSVGGWSGSAINLTTSEDEGRTWSNPRRLVTSPFLNLSTLVKGPPFFFQDGAIGLPVYHEFIGKFGELLRLDREGGVIYKRRLSWGRHSLQPVIVPITVKKALGLMRYGGRSKRRLLSFGTDDGGLTWSRPVKTDLPNPNSAVAAIRSSEGELLLAYNNTERKRNDLSIAVSGDNGATWRVIHSFEREAVPQEGPVPSFSYPSVIRARNGDFHLLYTWNKTRIKHVRFNRSWLEKML